MDNLEKQNEDIGNILGFGKELKVLVGAKEDGQQDIRVFHFTPASLEDIPTLMQKLNIFFENGDVTKWTEKDTKNGAEVLFISLKKMHPKLTVDEVIKTFSLGIMAKAIRIVMDINDFLSEVQGMNQMMADSKITLPPTK